MNKELIKRLRNNKVTLGHGEYGVDPLCIKAADEIEATGKDYALLQKKYDEQVVEIDRLREVLRINTDQQAEHIKTLLESWEKERKILTDEIATLRKQLSDASWNVRVLRELNDERSEWR